MFKGRGDGQGVLDKTLRCLSSGKILLGIHVVEYLFDHLFLNWYTLSSSCFNSL